MGSFSTHLPVIFGLEGHEPNAGERALFAQARPAGFILFKRNIKNHAQLTDLCASLRECVGSSDLAILIDQEGGRVARLGPPDWPKFPAAARFAALYDRAPMTAIEAMRCNAEAMAHALAKVGITVNCAPLLDLGLDETHDAIGDRSFGAEPMRVAALGRAMLDGLRAGGVAGVIKHMPGQGRALGDTHHELPRISAALEVLEADFEPFVSLANAPIGMTSHCIYEAIDADLPATLSAKVIAELIRGKIDFEGLLISDDLTMDALSGTAAERTTACLAAGCDIALHCSGNLAEMRAIAEALPPLRVESAARLEAALSWSTPHFDADRLATLLAKRDQLMATRA